MSRKQFLSPNLIVIGAVITLAVLIGGVILVASEVITSTVSNQFRRQEQQIVETLARQTEFLFETLGNDLLDVASRSGVQAIYTHQAEALASLARMGERHAGTVRNIVRLASDGSPRYAWPPELQARVSAEQPLDWEISPALAADIIQSGSVQFKILPAPGQELVYLLAVPIVSSNGITELLVVELEFSSWLTDNLGQVDLGGSGQLWLIDEFGRMLYQASSTAVDWSTPSELPIPLLLNAQAAQVLEYRSADGLRQAAFAPVDSEATSFVVLISRLVDEAYQVVGRQLTLLSVLTVVIIVVIALLAWVAVRQNLRTAQRRQAEEERRQVVATLLNLTRAVNSSLDLNEVLERILDGLAGLVYYDGASVMLLEDSSQMRIMATRGTATADVDDVYALSKLQAAQEIVATGQPVLVSDCLNDSRWTVWAGNPIRAWLGVPLRVEDETVGVLNINSLRVGGFKPVDSETALAFADQAGVAIHTARLHRLQIQHYEQDLANARDIQTSLLPQEQMRLPQLAVVGRSLPAQVVSGDFYQYLPRLDGCFGMAVGDVTGKGMPAALLMAVLTTVLRREFESQVTVAELFDHLNVMLMQRMQARHMTGALAMAVFEPDMRRVEIANAGMVQPYWRAANGSWQSVPVSGYPLGASLQRPYTSHRLALEPGTMLVFISDGVVEAQNSSGEFFSFERLEALLEQLPPDVAGEGVIDALLAAVHVHLDGLDPQDDITVVVTQVLTAEQ
ncbi:SpoIIE family protein phosphatase [Chloroflexota bacterium]